jgi:hypothetical protein
MKALLKDLNIILEECESSNSHISNITQYYFKIKELLSNFKKALNDIKKKFNTESQSTFSIDINNILKSLEQFTDKLKDQLHRRFEKQYSNNFDFDILLTVNPSQKNLKIIEDNHQRKSNAFRQIKEKYKQFLKETNQNKEPPKKSRKIEKQYYVNPENNSLDFEFIGGLLTTESERKDNDELDQYLESHAFSNEDETVLHYWRKQPNSPLKIFMKKFIQVPSSNAAVERVWSVAKDILSDKRYNMKNTTFEQVLFVKCNEDLMKKVY